jgi:Ca2+/H+ antiporter, TMEM165/GDT1 family
MHTVNGFRKLGIKRTFFIPVALLFFTLLFAVFVMLLWNATLPGVLGVNCISYWQAVGLLILSKILFSGFPARTFGHNFHDPRKEIIAKWKHLTPEERENMINQWMNRFEHKAKQE